MGKFVAIFVFAVGLSTGFGAVPPIPLVPTNNALPKAPAVPKTNDVSEQIRALERTILNSVWCPVEIMSCNPDDIEFWLYTDPNNPNPQILKYNDTSSVANSAFDRSKGVKIFIHGFYTNGTDDAPQTIKNAYLQASVKYNVIIVNWGKLAEIQGDAINYAIYAFAVNNADVVGKRAGNFTAWLVSQNFTTLEQVHIIGHSEGAHVAGTAANVVKQLKGAVHRLTGLDPAGPGFLTGLVVGRPMTQDDAVLVDVYHTDAFRLATFKNCGKVDFWIDNGVIQPQCPVITPLQEVPYTLTGSCSHAAAYRYFAVSITTPENSTCAKSLSSYLVSPTSSKCTSCVSFGETWNGKDQGMFFVASGNNSTYNVRQTSSCNN